MSIEEGTLYPLLRRLEAQGFLDSEWRMEDGPPRRYYTLSLKGVQHCEDLTQSWRILIATMDQHQVNQISYGRIITRKR